MKKEASQEKNIFDVRQSLIETRDWYRTTLAAGRYDILSKIQLMTSIWCLNRIIAATNIGGRLAGKVSQKRR